MAQNLLENLSTTSGRMRFIGGLSLIDSGGTLQVVGQFDGTGNFEWSGPWKFDSGDGEIVGNVNLTGDFDLTGQMNVTGGIDILGPGKIEVGKVIIENGRITADTGSNQVVIDGATGKVTAVNMRIDPTASGGALTFTNGARIFTDASTVQILKGNSVVQVWNDYARLQTAATLCSSTAEAFACHPRPSRRCRARVAAEHAADECDRVSPSVRRELTRSIARQGAVAEVGRPRCRYAHRRRNESRDHPR